MSEAELYEKLGVETDVEELYRLALEKLLPMFDDRLSPTLTQESKDFIKNPRI